MMNPTARYSVTATALLLVACSSLGSRSSPPKVGPPNGTVFVVGGGAMSRSEWQKFIELAGGPDALIIDVPTAGGAKTYAPDWRGANGMKAAGAKNVFVLHTIDKAVANSDTFVAHLANAGGVWFEGGRHFHLVDSYAGTKTEKAFHDVLARGGVVGGSSAGASILGDYMPRGAPSEDNLIMSYPGYEQAFAFLRGVAIDQHVVARERLADLADSIMPKHPKILGMSEDEGTVWIVRGDVAEIAGRNKAFVYGGKDTPDAGKPFLTLRPGDKYDLAKRRVIHRAIQESALTQAFVDSQFESFAATGKMATVLVAQAGKVFVNSSYGVPPQRKYMPTTTMPNFALGDISGLLNSVVREPTARDTGRLRTYAGQVNRSVYTPSGMHKTRVDTVTHLFESNVDELYRFEVSLADSAQGWSTDRYHMLARQSAFADSRGMRAGYVRFPERRASIIVLTNDDNADVRAIVDRIADRLLAAREGVAAPEKRSGR